MSAKTKRKLSYVHGFYENFADFMRNEGKDEVVD